MLLIVKEEFSDSETFLTFIRLWAGRHVNFIVKKSRKIYLIFTRHWHDQIDFQNHWELIQYTPSNAPSDLFGPMIMHTNFDKNQTFKDEIRADYKFILWIRWVKRGGLGAIIPQTLLNIVPFKFSMSLEQLKPLVEEIKMKPCFQGKWQLNK